MNTIDQAVLALLAHSPEPANVLVKELRQWTDGKVYQGDPRWLPGDVLCALDRLILAGKAVQVEGGYRLPLNKPNQQTTFLQEPCQ